MLRSRAYKVTVDGTVVPSSADVVTLFRTGLALDQLNTSGDWWTQPLTGGAGTELSSAPADYAPPAVPITITPTTEAVSATEGVAANPFAGVVITDANVGQTETATLTATGGTLSATTFSGTAAAVAADLDAVTFTPTAVGAATVTASIEDTAGETASATSTVTAAAPAPSFTVSPAGTIVKAGGTNSITDTLGNVWSLNASSNELVENGTLTSAAYTYGALVWTGSALYVFTTKNIWVEVNLSTGAGTKVPNSGLTSIPITVFTSIL